VDIVVIQLVELKSGETYNGVLVNVDHWMNLNLTKVTCTSREGDKFWKMTGIYIKGSTIKYMSIPEEVLANTPDEMPLDIEKGKNNQKSNRGGRGGRGGKDFASSSSTQHNKSDRGGRGGGRGHADNRGGSTRGSTRGGRGTQYKPRGTETSDEIAGAISPLRRFHREKRRAGGRKSSLHFREERIRRPVVSR
jgi:U6 snRNA-associated Sm-like protein LSm4